MAKRSRHPNKEIEAAIRYVEERGWTCDQATGHPRGRLSCPLGARGGCQYSIWSTTRNASAFAARIRRLVDRREHRAGK